MNLMFAAGLLDGPWIVLVFVILSAVANWLSKRRQEKQLDEHSELPPPPARAPRKPQSDVNVEEILRRLMGEEATPHPAPPPPQRVPERPARAFEEAEEGPARRSWQQKPQPVSPPVISISPPTIVESAAVHVSNAQLQRAYDQAHRSDQSQRGQHAARVLRSRSSGPGNNYWRSRKNVRQAFIASLVLGPPKGLEP